MSGISINARVKQNFKLVRRNVENLKLAIPKIGRATIDDVAHEIQRRMSKSGKKITYPVHWDSIKQRIKVIILILRKQGYLPYERTDELPKGWKVDRLEKGSRIYNTRKGSKYVYGNMRGKGQSRIHQGRWPLLRTVYDAVIKTVPKRVRDNLRSLPKVS